MGSKSIVSGHIEGLAGNKGQASSDHNRKAITAFEFDAIYPFTNIFWTDTPAKYAQLLTVGFAGCYNRMEEGWQEWLWKFSSLLSTLEATEALVNLSCFRGNFFWRLQPVSYIRYMRREIEELGSLVGQEWVIVECSPNDFTLTPWPDDNRRVMRNPATGNLDVFIWDKFVRRWEEVE